MSQEQKPIKPSNNKYSSGLTLPNFLLVIPKALSLVHLVQSTQKTETCPMRLVLFSSHARLSSCVFTLHTENLITYPPSSARNILNTSRQNRVSWISLKWNDAFPANSGCSLVALEGKNWRSQGKGSSAMLKLHVKCFEKARYVDEQWSS